MPGQRLLAEIDLFMAPRAVVLSNAKYWNRDFVRHFVEAWDDIAYVDPHAAMRLAQTAVELVEKLDDDARQVLRPRALATLGSSHRALEQLPEAERVFAEVAALHLQALVPRLDEADYCRRMAYLRMDQGRFDDSLSFACQAVVLCRAEQADCELGRAYAARGTVYLRMVRTGKTVPTNEPVRSLNLALERIDPRKAPHAHEAAVGNLALALLHGYPCDLDRALAMLRKTLRLQARLRITKKTLPNAQVRWMIGLVYLRGGSLSQAEEVLRRARRVLMGLGYVGHVAWISLDLARVYAARRQWGRLRILAEEILSLKEIYIPGGLAALQAWHRAILREHVSDRIWRKVLDAVRWRPLAPGRGRQEQPIVFTHRGSAQAPPLW